MRITYFMDTFRLGGAERFLGDLAAGVARVGHKVTVISPQADLLELVRTISPEPVLVQTKVDVWAARSRPARIGSFARSLPELPKALRRARGDVLHVNNGGYPGSAPCLVAATVGRLTGSAKTVLSVHNPAWARSALRGPLQAAGDNLIWRAVDSVHATSAFVEESLVARRGMPRSLCLHIPYGVEPPAAPADQVSALRSRLAPERGLLLGLVAATGEPHKGHVLLVEALARTEGINAVVVGPHPGDSFVAEIERLGLTDRVTLVGPVAAGEVGPYLHAVDLLVVPSTAYESLPLVILEAMAAGKPVFASRLSGIPEAVGDGTTGRLFEPGAIGELAALLDDAGRDIAGLALMGAAGRERWIARFSTGAMVASMLTLYEDLLADGVRG